MIPPEHTIRDWHYYPPAAQKGYEFPSYDANRPVYDPQHPFPGWVPRPHPSLIPAPPDFRDERQMYDQAPQPHPAPPPPPGVSLNSLPPELMALLQGAQHG